MERKIQYKNLNILFGTSILAFITYLLLDLLLSGFLFFNSKKESEKYFLQNYPLAIRSALNKSSALPKKAIKNTSVSEYNAFSLLGFFEPSLIGIIKDNKKIASLDDIEEFKKVISSHKTNNGKILVAVGGSTTASAQMTNWPTQIEKLLRNDNYLIINAGHNGYTSFQENILLFQILFPILNPYYPDTVISLTGVNDISRAVSSILLRDIYKPAEILKPAIIHTAYIGNDINSSLRMSGNSVIRNNLISSKILKKFMPSLHAFLKTYSEDVRSPETFFDLIGSKDKKNFMRIGNLFISVPQASGYFVPSEAITNKNLKAEIYTKYSDMVKGKNAINHNEAQNKLQSWSSARNKLFKVKPTYNLKRIDRNVVINNLLSNHSQTYNYLKSFGINYYAFLQPISKGDYESNLKDIPSYDYNLIHWYMRKDIKGHDYKFDGIGIFSEISQEIKNPPFSNFFFKIEFPDSSIMKEDPFIADNIHYYEFGSYFIAEEMLEKIHDRKNNINSYLLKNN